MAQNQYDPYGSEQNLSYGDMVKDAATMPLKPSSYLGLYATLPTMWSTSKGVAAPFIGKHLESGGWKGVGKAVRSAVTSASKKGFAGWAGLASKSALGVATMGWSSKGTGMVGEKFMSINFNKRILNAENRMKADLLTRTQGFYGTGDRATKAADAAFRHFRKEATKGKFNIGKGLGFTLSEEIKSKDLRGHYLLKSALKGKNKQLLFKLGMGAGKAVSIIGGAMLAWDLISMVAEPTGRAIVRGLDNVMTQYQQRFMPEVGGKLQMSYLSQGSATERQRAIQAISKSYINGRSAFGQEASYMHQGY